MLGARSAVGWVTVVVLASAAASARANQPSWTLAWSAPAECPDAHSVRDTVSMWLEQSLERSDPRGMRVDARVSRDGTGFVLQLVLWTASGRAHENLRSDRCETLASVIALKVALAADPGAWFEEIEPGPDPNAARLGLRVGGGLAGALLPGAAPAIGLTAFVRFGGLSIELGASYAFEGALRGGAPAGIGADLDLWLASLRTCANPRIGPVEIPLCGGIELGSMHGALVRSPMRFESTAFMAALSFGTGLRIPIAGILHAWLGLDGLFLLEIPRYDARGAGILWEPERFGGRAQLGIELIFD